MENDSVDDCKPGVLNVCKSSSECEVKPNIKIVKNDPVSSKCTKVNINIKREPIDFVEPSQDTKSEAIKPENIKSMKYEDIKKHECIVNKNSISNEDIKQNMVIFNYGNSNEEIKPNVIVVNNYSYSNEEFQRGKNDEDSDIYSNGELLQTVNIVKNDSYSNQEFQQNECSPNNDICSNQAVQQKDGSSIEAVQQNECSLNNNSSSIEAVQQNESSPKNGSCSNEVNQQNDCEVDCKSASDDVVEYESPRTSSPEVEIYLPPINITNIKIEIEDENESGEAEQTYPSFTRCQADSGTDDSESDSSDSSCSSRAVSISEEEEVVRKPSKPRNEAREGVEKRKKKVNHLYKGEMDIDDLPPIEDLHITVPEEECEPLGTVCSIVNQLVVVESMENKPALNLDSLLFKKDGECLGQIFDVFGPVKIPYYTLRFNSKDEIISKGIDVGQIVYCAPQTKHTKYVFVYQLMKQKGSDASWKHNYEVPDTMVDFSDDEEEKRAKRKHHQKTRDRPYCQGKDHTPAQKLKTVIKTEFNHDYNHCSRNEWYRSRVSELNQFNGSNWNHHHNQQNQQQRNFSTNQGTVHPSFPLQSPPPLLRPQTPNNWAPPPPNAQFGPSAIPHNHNGPVHNQFFPNPFALQPQSFNSPQQIPYEKLNSTVQFTNPIMQFPGLLSPPPPPPPPPSYHQTSQLSNRNTNPQMNLPPHIPNPFNKWHPPPPPPPQNKQESSNYFNQPPPNY